MRPMCLPEQGLDLISGAITIDDATFNITITRQRSLLDVPVQFTRPAGHGITLSCSFIIEGTLDQMVAIGVAEASYVR